eukprot:Skav205603  [mRNA]  locus=scaffold460:167596:168270:+ [translate_table: standard]
MAPPEGQSSPLLGHGQPHRVRLSHSAAQITQGRSRRITTDRTSRSQRVSRRGVSRPSSSASARGGSAHWERFCSQVHSSKAEQRDAVRQCETCMAYCIKDFHIAPPLDSTDFHRLIAFCRGLSQVPLRPPCTFFRLSLRGVCRPPSRCKSGCTAPFFTAPFYWDKDWETSEKKPNKGGWKTHGGGHLQVPGCVSPHEVVPVPPPPPPPEPVEEAVEELWSTVQL